MMISMLAARIALAAFSLGGVTHSGPCTLQTAVTAPAHGYAAERVEVSQRALDCRGPVHDVTVSAYTADGGEETETAKWSHGHWLAKLRFSRADAGTWYLGGVTGECRDGSVVQYWGKHPAFTVMKGE